MRAALSCRNYRLGRLALLMVVFIGVNGIAMAGGDGADFEGQATALVGQFAGQLKPRLMEAIAEGGPAHAVGVCAEVAPAIAHQLSEQSGWTIRRVSTRSRNPSAVADHWEAAMIRSFETRLAKGAEPGSLSEGEFTPEGYRFAKAQIAEPLCLACHGQTLAPEVAKLLAKHYPEDLATGYEAGQIRWIFSLTRR